MIAMVTTAIEIVTRMALMLLTVVLIFSKPWPLTAAGSATRARTKEIARLRLIGRAKFYGLSKDELQKELEGA